MSKGNILGIILVTLWSLSSAHAEVALVLVPSLVAEESQQILARKEVLSQKAVFSESEKKSLRELGRTALSESRILRVSSEQDAQSLKSWIKARGFKASVERNSMGRTLSEPLENYQWALHNTGEPQRVIVDDVSSTMIPGKPGEDLSFGNSIEETPVSKKIRVAILDTGVDYGHPNLRPNLVNDAAECAALKNYQDCLKKESKPECDAKWAKVDANQNGYPLDCSGWNVTAGRNPNGDVMGNSDASDSVGHGTHLAGIIAAASNGRGIRGVSQNVEILPVKVIQSAPSGPLRPQWDLTDALGLGPQVPTPGESDHHWSAAFADLIARGMLYAIRSNAQVINMSLGWPSAADTPLMREMVQLAIKKGIIVVAAAGNDSADSRVLPCQYDGVICVASHGPDGAFSHFSNYGTFVDIAAPGLGILSTWPRGVRSVRFTAKEGYEYKNGTSMAAPYIAGAAARLLAAGVPPAEIYPRLILGARETEPSPFKYLRSGNIDLSKSAEITPQSLILPEKKEPIKIDWDRKQNHLSLNIALKNFWKDASDLEITAEVTQESGDHFAHLSLSRFDFSEWKQGETKLLTTELVIDNPRVDGRLLIEFKVSQKSLVKSRVFRVPLEISVPIGRKTTDSEIEVFPILGGAVLPGSEIRSVTALDGIPTQDYFAFSPGATRGERVFQLFRQEGSSYRLTAQGKLLSEGDLYLLQRLDLHLNGKTNFVFLFKIPPAKGKMPVFRIQTFDEKMQLEESIDYDNQISVLSDRFKWLRIEVSGEARLVPAWMSFGKEPPSEKPPFDVWDPTPAETLLQRLYYLTFTPSKYLAGNHSGDPNSAKADEKAQDLLRSVPMPEGYTLTQVLSQSDEQRLSGTLSLVLSHGDGYDLDFFQVELKGSKLELARAKPLDLPEFRMLLGIQNSLEILPLDPLASVSGTAFPSESPRGTKRTTLLYHVGNGEKLTRRIFDRIQKPSSTLDSIARVSGAYAGNESGGIFSESHYRLEYLDLVSGESASTSLDRFSFLPSFIFSKTFFPVVAQDLSRGASQDRLPGVYIPASLGVTDAIEIVVPVYDSERLHRLAGLARPARLRLKADGSCVAIGNSVAPSSSGSSRIGFFCGDRFLRVPVQF